MANEMVTREVAFGVRHVPEMELLTVTAGIPTDQVEQFASYLLNFIEARMWELGDTPPMPEEFTVHHFLLRTVEALRQAAQADEPRAANAEEATAICAGAHP